jgi:Gliding motility associated protein GldN
MVKINTFKGPLSIFAFLWLPVLLFSQKEVKETYINHLRYVYTLEAGQMNGAYMAYHANGIKKAEGQFQHNLRVGKWSVWDSTGEMSHQRIYDNNGYDFNIVFQQSKPKDNNVIEPHINLRRDTNGLRAFGEVKEKSIIHSVTHWRMVSNRKQNAALFENNNFYNWLIKSVLEDKIRAYSSNNDKFKSRMTPLELAKVIDSLDGELVGFRLKEMRYFTDNYQLSETVILGLAPVVRPKKSPKSATPTPLFWVYMPNARKELAQNSLPDTGFPADVKNYDDLFFNRYFSSTIIKESNIHNRSLSEYLNEAEAAEKAQDIELEAIDLEHALWVYAPTYVRK